MFLSMLAGVRRHGCITLKDGLHSARACSELPPMKPVRKFNLAMGQRGK
jgi:hypothetical protein